MVTPTTGTDTSGRFSMFVTIGQLPIAGEPMTTEVEAGGAAAAYATASDPDRMKAIFNQHLQTADGSPVELVACEVVFARRGDSRSLFQYRVSLRDPAGGAARSLDVTAVAYGGKRGPRLEVKCLQPVTDD